MTQMADTRCANPEYQLDVDTMMLEYTVYKAIEAQSQNLRYQVEELSEDASDGHVPSDRAIELREESSRLQQSCDHLISLFRFHHPSTPFSAGCDYNLRILQLMVLLEHWIQLSSRTLLGPGSNWMFPNRYRPGFVYPQRPDESLVRQLGQERAMETVFRRNWLGLRYGEDSPRPNDSEDDTHRKRRKLARHDADSDSPMDGSVDDRDESSQSTIKGKNPVSSDGHGKHWINQPRLANEERPCLNAGIISGKTRLGVVARSSDVRDYFETHSLFFITLFELIPIFMDLSAELASIMGNINERWTELANEFMWQSALERLQQMPDSQYTKPSDDAFKTIAEDFGSRVWVEECFAWGSVERPSQTSMARIKQELHHLGVSPLTDDIVYDRLRTEDHISAMFRQGVTDGSSGDDDGKDNIEGEEKGQNSISIDESQEYPPFSQTRQRQLSSLLDLIIEERPVSDNIPFYISVRRLCEKSPIKPFLQNLLSYLDSIFTVNMNSSVDGKPVLVQIEQGGLEGLDQNEFESFLDRVGLKMSGTSGEVSMESVVKWAK